MSDENKPVLAVYDFSSKQEYIYRTNRMKEITGASEIIATLYEKFLTENSEGKRIQRDWQSPDAALPCDDEGYVKLPEDKTGIVIYEGGGNLLVLYRDRSFYLAANREFSKLVVETAYALDLIVASEEWQEDDDFKDVHKRLMTRSFGIAKRIAGTIAPCNGLPYTMVDPATFQAIDASASLRGISSEELSKESLLKLKAYNDLPVERKLEGKLIDEIAKKKNEDSLIAIIYIDGNSVGERLKEATKDAYSSNEQVRALREFSKKLHDDLVTAPLSKMKEAIEGLEEQYRSFRVIVDHGDEITFICNAHAVPFVLDAYFSTLAEGYTACAGIAYCHAHAPYADVYRIAEQCCEAGKERNREILRRVEEQALDDGLNAYEVARTLREASASFIDFHYVRSGITGSLEHIRAAQENSLVNRPYRLDEYCAFLNVGKQFAAPHCRIQRQDLKALNRAIVRGESWYRTELARIEAKDYTVMRNVQAEIDHSAMPFGSAILANKTEVQRRLLFEVTSYWDMFREYCSLAAVEFNANAEA